MKVLIYCTMAKPYLHQDHLNGVWFVNNEKTHNGFCSYDEAKNGSVCIECDCKEALLIPCELCDDGRYRYSFVHTKVKCDEFIRRSHLLPYELDDYSYPKSVYAYHFENVKPIDPMPITKLYRDGTMVYPLTRAPQSYCFAYRKVETTKEDYLANVGKDESRYYLQENGKFFYSEKVLIFSIRSPWLCKIANGEKDLEVRKTRINNAGIEYK